MRIGKRGFRARIKGNLRIEFGEERLTSHAGLELFRRFVVALGLTKLLHAAGRRLKLGGDFGFSSAVLLVVGMLLIGARRLRHLAFVREDPILLRFAGLSRAPDERSLSRMLKKLGHETWPDLDRVNIAIVQRAVEPLSLQRLTLDLDGSVVTTGLQVERAARGFNPHHRRNPSYYPILATIAQTGHVLAHKNRAGNVHDSHQSSAFLRHAVRAAREGLLFAGLLEVRADSAFFQRDFLRACDWHRLEYAIKVPMWPWLNLRGVVKQKDEADWQWVDRKHGVQGLFAELPIPAWKRTERVAIYRKRINHQPFKGRQLELFNPDDGYWEYSVVATNKTLGLRALWHFANGRGIQEKVTAELKSGYAFDAIPTNRYSANTAWQKLNIVTHNIVTSFQLVTAMTPKPRTMKRTTNYLLRSIRTLRFEWLNKAARLLRPNGTAVLRLADNAETSAAYEQIERRLVA